MPVSHPTAASPLSAPDHDLQQMAQRGHGVPSQDLNPQAQYPLSELERQREWRSSFYGGGLLAGVALGATVGMWLAGPLGVLLGCVGGALGGTLAGWSYCQRLYAPMPGAQALPLVE